MGKSLSFEDSALSRERDGASSVKKPDGMAILDESRGGYRVFVGDLGSRVGKYELEREFQHFGPILDVWVARNPPGFAFLVYKYGEDAEEAVKKLHGKYVFSECLSLLFIIHYLKIDINPSIAGTLICV